MTYTYGLLRKAVNIPLVPCIFQEDELISIGLYQILGQLSIKAFRAF